MYILSTVIGILTFLFVFWKKLREDYASEIVFKTAFQILFGILLGVLISSKFFPGWFWWSGVLGGFAGLALSVFKLRVKFYETFEAFVISSLPGVALLFLADSVVHFSFISFVAFLVTLIMIFIYYYLDLHYKEFTWYRSGKIGFSGLTTLGLIFLARTVLALTGGRMLSFVGRNEAIVSGMAFSICLLTLINLGRSKK